MSHTLSFASACASRTITREQWHAERRRRGQRTRQEVALAPYAEVTVRIYREPMPTGRYGPALVNSERRTEVVRRVHARKVKRLVAERQARLREHAASTYFLPGNVTRLACFDIAAEFVRPGESERETALRVAEEMRLVPHATQIERRAA